MPSPDRRARRIRILIADDHKMFRQGLRLLLEGERDLQIVGEAHAGAQAISLARELKPDILLLDVAMPGQSGLDVAHLHEAGTTGRVILLSAALHRAEIPGR